MKIAVDLVRVVQEWDPSSGMQQNYLVLGIDGTTLKVLCSEETAFKAVQAAAAVQGRPVVPEPEADDTPPDEAFLGQTGHFNDEELDQEPIEEVVYDEAGDRVFGGGVDVQIKLQDGPVEAPAIFNTDDLPSDDEPVRRELTSFMQRKQQIGEIEARRPGVARKLEKMRRRAQQPPPSRIRMDEMGYPEQEDVAALQRASAKASQIRQQSYPKPEVEVSQPTSALDNEDEDGFGQG